MTTEYSDELTSIIKSIVPVKFVFSKKSKEFDRYFIYKNLDNFIKTFDKTNRARSAFFPDSPKNNNNQNKYIYENDIQKTFKLLEKIKNTNKYLPRSLREKNKDKIMKENRENYIKNREIKNFKRLLNYIQPSENFFDRITLDPGRYNPKYSLRFKRTINTYFKYPDINLKKTELNNEKENIISKYESKRVKSSDVNKSKELIKNKRKFNKIDPEEEKKRKYSLLKNYINQSSSQINLITKHINSKKHISSFNKTSSSPFMNINLNSNALTPKTEKITLKKNLYRKNNNKKVFSARIQKHNFNFNIENKNEEEKNKFSLSSGFQKNIISFDKIRGRNKNLFNVREEIKSTYAPKYDTIRPKMQVKEFTLRKSLRSFKKYVVGKIIRSYHCTPNYFIFDINENKNIEGNYRYIFEKKY